MSSFFQLLQSVQQKPKPFEFYTAADLWTDEHISSRMLSFHLNADIDVASRRISFIDASVEWMIDEFDLNASSRVVDFGCGPGLYTERLARTGCTVTGVDFSSRSIEYARKRATELDLSINYQLQDYNQFESSDRYDLILMVMCDFCALSPEQRQGMLTKFASMLRPGGAIVFDVYSLAAFEKREETVLFGQNLMDGFWSAREYYGFQHSFSYKAEKVFLDKYTIIEADRARTVYNWLQYFSPDSLQLEVEESGLVIDKILANLTGDPYQTDADEFAVVLRHRTGFSAR